MLRCGIITSALCRIIVQLFVKEKESRVYSSNI